MTPSSGPKRIGTVSPSERDRFLSHIQKGEDPNDCWIWIGARFESNYGMFWMSYERWLAHRVSYAMHVGDTDQHLDHLCHDPAFCAGGPTCPHRPCVNPAHLKPEPTRTNVLRGAGPSAQNARKTRCNRGHEFTPENTGVGSNGERVCRQCARDKTAAWREEHRDEINAKKRANREHVVYEPRKCETRGCENMFVPIRGKRARFCPECRAKRTDYQREYMREYRKRKKGSE